jgi:transcriptional regulator with XRE-family HTH domain
MYSSYVRDRITQLRLQKGVSEYKMSYDLGHSKGYINNISSGKSLPSMAEFFAICEYFQITPIQFFDGSVQNPTLLHDTAQTLAQLDEADIHLIHEIITHLRKKNNP